jgi:tetratricopeptide (TPR) repeat protein
MVCAWPLLLTFQLGTLVAGILSSLKSKKLLGVVSVHNCSLRRPIISDALSCICTNTPSISAGHSGKQSSGVAFAQAGRNGRKCTGSADCLCYSLNAGKGGQKSPEEIGRELQVRYLLEGRVRKAESQVRVNVQLIDTSTGFQVWADDFTGDLKDVFALQKQTALRIAGALNLKLSPQEQQAVQRRYTQNADAYDAYLRGQALAWSWDNPQKLEASRKEFETALQFDPQYPLALAGLSRVENFYYRNVDSDEAHLRRGEEFAQRALAIDPQLAEAHVSLGLAYANRFEYARAAEQEEQAVRLEPDNAQAWVALSWVLGYKQPPEPIEAEKAAREAIRLQPSIWGAYYQLGRALLLQRRYQEAIAAMEHAKELSPASTTLDIGLGQVYLAQGDTARAVAVLSKSTAKHAANDLFWQSSAYAADGDKQRALATLQKAFTAGYRDFAAIDASPYFQTLRSDPRFQQLVQRYRR